MLRACLEAHFKQEKLCTRWQEAYLLLNFLLGGTLLLPQGLGSCFLKLSVPCVRCPVGQLLVGVHMPHAAPTEVPTGVKIVCKGSTTCSRAGRAHEECEGECQSVTWS